MERDQVERFLVDERVDHADQHVGDELLHDAPLPAAGEREHRLLRLLHLALVGAHQEIDELCVRAAQDRAARDESRAIHRTRQRKRARLRDDRLVEVEERSLHAFHGTAAR